MGRWGRRHKQLLDDVKEKRVSWKLKKEALGTTPWRTRLGRGYGVVIRWTTKWMNDIPKHLETHAVWNINVYWSQMHTVVKPSMPASVNCMDL
jgi:hypothetical protein